jgi:hypothetical protein
MRFYPHLSSRTNARSYFLFRRKSRNWLRWPAPNTRGPASLGLELAYPRVTRRRRCPVAKSSASPTTAVSPGRAFFLVDEPFANLDQALSENYRVKLKIVLRQFNITPVYVAYQGH